MAPQSGSSSWRCAPVVADVLGYHDKTTARLLNEGGGAWTRYAAGEHGR